MMLEFLEEAADGAAGNSTTMVSWINGVSINE